MRVVGFAEGDAALDWIAVSDAIAAGHERSRADLMDGFLRRGEDTLLDRAAWIEGLGIAVKTVTVFPANRDAPSVNGGLCLYSDADGTLDAVVDFHLVTKWKTAADSLLAARRLAPERVGTVLIVGAGTVARNVRSAYGAGFPGARFEVWNRTRSAAEALAAAFEDTRAVDDLEDAVGRADIVVTTTMSRTPVLRGAWLRAGQHVDLIGAFRADMREADDAALARARLFVDSRATTIEHIGELAIPIASGAITVGDVVADYYDLPSGAFARDGDEITICKNGGGAHLDLMVARHILDAVG